MYQFCYEELVRAKRGETKRSRIFEAVQDLYGEDALSEDRHVTLYAKRHAERNALPWPILPDA
jgi:hypothetical protein